MSRNLINLLHELLIQKKHPDLMELRETVRTLLEEADVNVTRIDISLADEKTERVNTGTSLRLPVWNCFITFVTVSCENYWVQFAAPDGKLYLTKSEGNGLLLTENMTDDTIMSYIQGITKEKIGGR